MSKPISSTKPGRIANALLKDLDRIRFENEPATYTRLRVLRRLRRDRERSEDETRSTVLSALELSVELQLLAANTLASANAGRADRLRTFVEHMWRAFYGLTADRENDRRLLFLAIVDEVTRTKLEREGKVGLVMGRLLTIDPDLARRLKDRTEELSELIAAWERRPGRPRRGEGKRPDRYELAQRLLSNLNVIAPTTMKRAWERGRKTIKARK